MKRPGASSTWAWTPAHRGEIVQFVRDCDGGCLQLHTLPLYCWPTATGASKPAANKHLTLVARKWLVTKQAQPLVVEAATLAAKLRSWGQRV